MASETKRRTSETKRPIGGFFGTRVRLVAFATWVCVFCATWTWTDFGAGEELGASLAIALEADVLVERDTLVTWDDRGPVEFTPILFLGRVEADAPRDLFYTEARLGSDAEVLATRHLRNITRTSSADEFSLLSVDDDHIAYLSRVSAQVDAVTLMDLRGESEQLTADWPQRARIQNAVSNLQESGRTAGFGRVRYALRPAADEVSIEVEDGRLSIGADGVEVVVDPEEMEPVTGAERVEWRPAEKGMPGTLTWVVDSVRNLSFVGPEPIAWLEHRVFSVKDAAQRAYYAMAGGPDTEAEVAAELGLDEQVTEAETRRRAELSITDPEIGWPPASLEPVVRSPARGEGEWSPVEGSAYVRDYPNTPPAFYTTYLQVDPDRPFTRVYVVEWDPRAVQLRIMSGTREPESATGETGAGMIPRDPETLRRVVGGFNGGFQSLHGEFGMMSEGRVYLPPKPWAATVAVFADGHVGMGSWLDPPEGRRFYQETWATRQIPDDMVEFRQNLTSVVEGDRFNPWRRWYWGAAPADDEEQAYIDRSGICLTREGFMAYFWGKSMGADELGEAMLAARCVRGIHLDMNQRHTAFEFYRVFERAEAQHEEALERPPREGFEFDVDVPYSRGWQARGRLLASSMTPMRFPRYIRRDPRDFFYLTLKPLLPGPSLSDEGEGEAFSTAGLPHAGYPWAFARARTGTEDDATWLVRIDASRAVPAPVAHEGAGDPLAYLTASSASVTGPLSIYVDRGVVGRRFKIGERVPRDARVVLAGEAITQAHGAGIGVDGDGFLVYAEGSEAIVQLGRAGVDAVIGLTDEQRLAFRFSDLTAGPDTYEREVDPGTALALLADERPATEVLFPNVEPRPYMYWGRMQDTRVRYQRGDGPRRFQAPDAGTP